MKCAWRELLSILPQSLRGEVDKLGKDDLQELRLRLGRSMELRLRNGIMFSDARVTSEDITYLINTACRYSPWAATGMAKGYLTAPGGHRIGLCGDMVLSNGMPSGFRNIQSACIRVARDFPGIGAQLRNLKGNILILGPPGSGKTTLLRDLIRQIATDYSVTVIDERAELFPQVMDPGLHTDILRGCPKALGVIMAIRTMGPAWVAVDEITSSEDCLALTEAGWCGVKLIATAHATDASDLRKRKIYRPMIDAGLFDYVVVMQQDKSYRWERL